MQVIQRLAPSFNFPRTTIADGSASVRPASLRGLGPDQVLVLINGKRRHTTALVHVNGTMGRGSTGADLNAIPVSAIERIEILRDGAAAQYGSDAIAGVINIVLKAGKGPGAAGPPGRDDRDRPGRRRGTPPGTASCSTPASPRASSFGNGWVFLTGEYRNRNRTNRAGRDPRDQIQAGDAAEQPGAPAQPLGGRRRDRGLPDLPQRPVPRGRVELPLRLRRLELSRRPGPRLLPPRAPVHPDLGRDLPDRLPPLDPTPR